MSGSISGGGKAGARPRYRVLQMHNRYRVPGGEDEVVRDQASLLRSAGHQVAQLQAINSSRTTTAALQLATSSWNRSAARRAEAAIDEFQPDVVHLHNSWFALSPAVARVSAGLGVPVVMSIHNFRLGCVNGLLYRDGGVCEDCVGRSPWPGVQHRCYRGSMTQSLLAAINIELHRQARTWTDCVSGFACLNEFSRSRMIAIGLPGEAIRIVPNSVSDPGPRDAPPTESDTVVYAGRLTDDKGVKRLVRAWKNADTPGLRLVVVGDGPDRDALVREASASSDIEILGAAPRDVVRSMMRRSRALIVPSRWYEGQPMVILEALAAALPILGSDLGGTAETLAPLGEGWLVGDGERAWTEAIQRLVDDDHVADGSARARAAYLDRHLPAVTLDSLIGMYELAVGTGSNDASS